MPSQNSRVLRAPRKHHSQGGLVTSLLNQYLCESKGVRHVADQDLPQLPIEVSTLDPVQMSIYPVDPAKKERREADVCRAVQFSPIRGHLFLPELPHCPVSPS